MKGRKAIIPGRKGNVGTPWLSSEKGSDWQRSKAREKGEGTLSEQLLTALSHVPAAGERGSLVC